MIKLNELYSKIVCMCCKNCRDEVLLVEFFKSLFFYYKYWL